MSQLPNNAKIVSGINGDWEIIEYQFIKEYYIEKDVIKNNSFKMEKSYDSVPYQTLLEYDLYKKPTESGLDLRFEFQYLAKDIQLKNNQQIAFIQIVKNVFNGRNVPVPARMISDFKSHEIQYSKDPADLKYFVIVPEISLNSAYIINKLQEVWFIDINNKSNIPLYHSRDLRNLKNVKKIGNHDFIKNAKKSKADILIFKPGTKGPTGMTTKAYFYDQPTASMIFAHLGTESGHDEYIKLFKKLLEKNIIIKIKRSSRNSLIFSKVNFYGNGIEHLKPFLLLFKKALVTLFLLIRSHGVLKRRKTKANLGKRK